MATAKETPKDSTAPSGATMPAPKLKRERRITAKLFKNVAVGLEHAIKIAGIINTYRIRPGPYGEYAAFIGTFRAVVGAATYSSDELILPVFPEKVLIEQFRALAGEAKNSEVRFAVRIFKKDDSQNTANTRKFTWEIQDIHKMSLPDAATDPLLKLLA